MVSTPNAPDGLFEKIEKEPEASCIYKRLFLVILTVLSKYTLRKKLTRLNNHLPLIENMTLSI